MTLGLRIIMLGKLRSGKTTVGSLICDSIREQKDIKLNARPLALPIYKEAKKIYAKYGLTWRKNRRLLEGIGEAMNNDYPNGDLIVEEYAKDFDPAENIYVEDCRRLTQANFFANLNIAAQFHLDETPIPFPGKTLFIRINATDEIRKARCLPGEWAEGHVTDTELDNWPADYEISNDGDDLIELKAKINALVESIKYD